jgi:hypothetical protein
MGERALRTFYHWLQRYHLLNDVKVEVHIRGKRKITLWLITLGLVNRWFHAKLSPIYRDRVNQEVELWRREDYCNAWRNTLERYRSCVYCGCDRFRGFETGWFITGCKTVTIRVGRCNVGITFDADTFSGSSCIPMIVFNAFVTCRIEQCWRCNDIEDMTCNYNDDDDIHQDRLHELHSRPCECVWTNAVDDIEFLALIEKYTKRLLQEGWSWEYRGKRLILHDPPECIKCRVSGCNGCTGV